MTLATRIPFARMLFVGASIAAGLFAFASGAQAETICATFADNLEIVRGLQRDEAGSQVLVFKDGEARKLLAAINVLPPETNDVSDRVIVFLRVDGTAGYAFEQDNGCFTKPGRLTPDMWDKVKYAAHPEGSI